MIIPLKKKTKTLQVAYYQHTSCEEILVLLNMNRCVPCDDTALFPEGMRQCPQGIRSLIYFSFMLRFSTSLIQTVTLVLQVLEREH